jgi:hypothetical protein
MMACQPHHLVTAARQPLPLPESPTVNLTTGTEQLWLFLQFKELLAPVHKGFTLSATFWF